MGGTNYYVESLLFDVDVRELTEEVDYNWEDIIASLFEIIL